MESPHIYQIYHFSWFKDAQEKRCHASNNDMTGTPCSLDVKTTAGVSAWTIWISNIHFQNADG